MRQLALFRKVAVKRQKDIAVRKTTILEVRAQALERTDVVPVTEVSLAHDKQTDGYGPLHELRNLRLESAALARTQNDSTTY